MYKTEHYHTYQEMTDYLKQCAKEHPDFFHLESLGSSREGREMWLATINDPSTGKHSEKPGYWIDGNTHAGEVTGTQCCLSIIDTLLDQREEHLKELLKRVSFYIVPRISVDGAELYLTTSKYLRSAPVMWPHSLEHFQGIEAKDLSGKGAHCVMRIADPSGEYKVSEKDPRLMIPRAPDDCAGEQTYYRLFPEGVFINYDGENQQAGTYHGLDLNRQYPANFQPGGQQKGAGPHPLFMEEAELIVKAVCARPNIVGAQSFHTFSGVVLRPFANRGDIHMPEMDLRMYKALGKRAEALAGYECISVNDNFRYSDREDTGGCFFEWAYEHRGILALTNEIWSLGEETGLKITDYVEYLCQTSEEHLAHVLSWCDKNLKKGSYFYDWQEVDHPQLGKVEVGGWNVKFTVQNPPLKFLDKEVKKNVDFTLACAKAAPHVIVRNKTIEALGGDLYKVSLELNNQGFMPTYGAKQALKVDSRIAPLGQLKVSDGQEIVSGKRLFTPEHLEGFSRSGGMTAALYAFFTNNDCSQTLHWVIKGKGKVNLEINYHRGGTVFTEWELN